MRNAAARASCRRFPPHRCRDDHHHHHQAPTGWPTPATSRPPWRGTRTRRVPPRATGASCTSWRGSCSARSRWAGRRGKGRGEGAVPGEGAVGCVGACPPAANYALTIRQAGCEACHLPPALPVALAHISLPAHPSPGPSCASCCSPFAGLLSLQRGGMARQLCALQVGQALRTCERAGGEGRGAGGEVGGAEGFSTCSLGRITFCCAGRRCICGGVGGAGRAAGAVPHSARVQFSSGMHCTALRGLSSASRPRALGMCRCCRRCRYDLSRFCPVNSVAFDHPDPSIFTVLTCPSPMPGGRSGMGYAAPCALWLCLGPGAGEVGRGGGRWGMRGGSAFGPQQWHVHVPPQVVVVLVVVLLPWL